MGVSGVSLDDLEEDKKKAATLSGDSYEDVKARMANFFEFLKKNYEGKNVAIVDHKAPQLSLDVLLKSKTWKQALAEDWRKTKAWKPGWEYEIK